MSPQYDFRIKSCCHPFEYIYCFNEHVQCTERFCCGMKSPSFNVIPWYTEQWDIIGIYLVYARYMPDIFINLDWLIYHSKGNDGAAITSQNSHVQITTNAGDMISFIKTHFLFSMNVWQVYTRCIPSIYISYLLCRHFAGLPGLPSAPGCLRPGLSTDQFRLGHWKSSNSRLGPAKVPHPVINLIDMAAPAWCRALAVSTPVFEGLLLSSSILIRNSRCGVAIKKARKEWHPPKKVFHPANIESGDRRRFIQLSNSIWLHSSSCSQEKILKGTEEDQVERNVFGILVVATSGCVGGRTVHVKNSCGRTIHMLSGSEMDAAAS